MVSRASFDPLVRPRPHGLFTQDPDFWTTVHLGGDGWEEQLAQQAAAARAQWADKVVVKDTHFHALPGTGDKAAAQVQRRTHDGVLCGVAHACARRNKRLWATGRCACSFCKTVKNHVCLPCSCPTG